MANYSLYTLENGRTVRVPNEAIERNMAILKISKQEAVDLWLYDEGYIDNEEADALTAKAKDNRVTATVHKAKSTEYKQKTQKERVAKADPTKEGIISAIAEMLPSVNAENVVIANKGKLITFTIGADSYKLDLIRQRPPKTEGK
jgi:hypothetical protein